MTIKITISMKKEKNIINASKKGTYLEILLRSPKTIFTTKDIALLWGENSDNKFRVRLSKYSKTGKLMRLAHGIYAKDENYDSLELATRLYTPSYISFETVLTRSGINFQYYNNIFVASYVTREIKVANHKILYVQIKDFVLTNSLGVETIGETSIATKERAFLDRLYVSKDYHFDNLNSLDWAKVFEILPIYRNKRMEKSLNELYKNLKANDN